MVLVWLPLAEPIGLSPLPLKATIQGHQRLWGTARHANANITLRWGGLTGS